MHVFIDVKPEDHDNLVLLLSQLSDDSVTMPNKKTKTRSEINRQNYERRKTKQSEIQTNSDEEEKEEKEEVSPLSSPSSLSSSPSNSPINYPITPFLPPLPEEKGEREEDFGGTDGKRGELRSFGPHVELSEKEFLALQKKYGYEETMQMIRNMNNYIGEDSKLIAKYKTRNHYLTLQNWKRRDEEKKQQQQQAKAQPKKTYTTFEVAEMMERGEL